MHINGPLQNNGNRPEPEVRRRVDSAATNNGLRPNAATESAEGVGSSQHVSAPEVAALKQRLQEIPEVRWDVVQAVSDRVASGELSGSEVLRQTAAAMLNG
jgi:hypothetical protein